MGQSYQTSSTCQGCGFTPYSQLGGEDTILNSLLEMKIEVLKFKGFAQDHSTRKWYMYSESVSNCTRKSLFFFYLSVKLSWKTASHCQMAFAISGYILYWYLAETLETKGEQCGQAELIWGSSVLSPPRVLGNSTVLTLYTRLCSLHHNATQGLISAEGN